MFPVANFNVINHMHIPVRLEIDSRAEGLVVRKLQSLSEEVEVELEAYRNRGDSCKRAKGRVSDGREFILEFAAFRDDYGGNISGSIRMYDPTIENGVIKCARSKFRDDCSSLRGASRQAKKVRVAWADGIKYRAQVQNENGEQERAGLREPQIGALHAIAAHWTLSNDPALVVMPTGTGKTEVMMASAIAAGCHRLLVVVPSDALRKQTAEKFSHYGILNNLKVIDEIPYPVIGTLKSAPTRGHIRNLRLCNVVITTMASIGQAPDDVQRAFANEFSHIFFDEAHHIQAATWKRFSKLSTKAKTLLMTATPFREDGKHIEGKIIYDYPLASAMDRGYFKPISFVNVFEPDSERADRAIAEAAVNRLRDDLGKGLDHLMMARAKTIDDAKRLFNDIYMPNYADLNPVLIHSQSIGKKAKLEALIRGDHQIVVCVNMFGEGFDLPNLKIAALHSIHKSLGVTLQFIGRFARTGGNVGDASFVANTADDGVPESLESLYLDDSDWNLLLPDLSYDAIDPQTRLSELVENLHSVAGAKEEFEISTLALRPKCSMHVYRADSFSPQHFAGAFNSKQKIYQPQISRQDRLLVLVVNQQDKLDWTDSRDIAVDSWDLYIGYYDEDRSLLYIHSSRKSDSGLRLAQSISENPVLVAGDEVFKVFGGLRRLTLHSVGLSSKSRNVRYQMFAGLDVRSAIDPVQQRSKLKSVVTGVGYGEGERKSVGCSRKGKLWSMRSGSLADWRDWCDTIGAKIMDPDISSNDFLRYTLIPTSITNLPDCEAVMADWPDQLFESAYFRFEVKTLTESFGFDECQIDLVAWRAGGVYLDFKLSAGETKFAVLRLELVQENEEDSYRVTQTDGDQLEIAAFGRSIPVAEFFTENAPMIRIEDGSQLSGNILLKSQEVMEDAFDREEIRTPDWTGVDITKESRWKEGGIRTDSVQHHFIQQLEQTAATFIIDDDDTGESADIVAIEETADRVIVYLWHCKYSSGAEPGHRVKDLYEVCGQAQKSVKWSWSLKTLIRHLIQREAKHKRGRESRFIRGSTHGLATLRKSARRKFVEYRIGIIQPGLSAREITPDQLSMLGATNSFVQVITDRPLMVVTSE